MTYWLCAGISKPWRVTDGQTDYGEFDCLFVARFLARMLNAGTK